MYNLRLKELKPENVEVGDIYLVSSSYAIRPAKITGIEEGGFSYAHDFFGSNERFDHISGVLVKKRCEDVELHIGETCIIEKYEVLELYVGKKFLREVAKIEELIASGVKEFLDNLPSLKENLCDSVNDVGL